MCSANISDTNHGFLIAPSLHILNYTCFLVSEYYRRQSRMGAGSGDGCRLVALVFALLFPPVSVFLMRGCSCALLLNILLTLLAYIPGMIHAFWVVLKNDTEDSAA